MHLSGTHVACQEVLGLADLAPNESLLVANQAAITTCVGDQPIVLQLAGPLTSCFSHAVLRSFELDFWKDPPCPEKLFSAATFGLTSSSLFSRLSHHHGKTDAYQKSRSWERQHINLT